MWSRCRPSPPASKWPAVAALTRPRRLFHAAAGEEVEASATSLRPLATGAQAGAAAPVRRPPPAAAALHVRCGRPLGRVSSIGQAPAALALGLLRAPQAAQPRPRRALAPAAAQAAGMPTPWPAPGSTALLPVVEQRATQRRQLHAFVRRGSRPTVACQSKDQPPSVGLPPVPPPWSCPPRRRPSPFVIDLPALWTFAIVPDGPVFGLGLATVFRSAVGLAPYGAASSPPSPPPPPFPAAHPTVLVEACKRRDRLQPSLRITVCPATPHYPGRSISLERL